jgi:hypothetical protein
MTPRSQDRRELLDSLGTLGRVRGTRLPWPTTILYRYRVEVLLTVVAGLAVLAVRRSPALASTAIVLAVLALALPAGRVRLRRRFWCTLTEHRLRTGLARARVHAPSGRLPSLVRTRPTPHGERVTLWCPAGLSAQDVRAARHLLLAACWARDLQVRSHPRHAHLVDVDVVRRVGLPTPPRPGPDGPAPDARSRPDRTTESHVTTDGTGGVP